MAIIRWHRPFFDFERFFDEDFLPVVPLRRSEAIADVYEEGDNVIVEMPLAGIDPEKTDIFIEDQRLIIKGSVEEKKEVREENYWRKEIRRGAFERQVALPIEVEGDKAEASYEKGILKVTLPKSERIKPQKIKIKIA